MPTAVGYVRASTDEQHIGPEAQRARIEAWCAAFEHDLVEVVEDLGVSGSIPLAERPGGAQVAALLDARRPDVDVLVVARLDRLTRVASDGLELIARCSPPRNGGRRRPVALVSLAEHIDLTRAHGRFAVKLQMLLADFERELIGERTSDALQEKRRTDRPHGQTPYGWDRDGDRLVANEAEQAVIGRMRSLRADGTADNAVAEVLNAEGVPTKRGGRWQANTVFRILRRDGEVATG